MSTESATSVSGFSRIAVLRVRVSGEPFDIPLDELEQHEGSALKALAARAPAIDGVPTLSFARDVRAFRVIRHYLATGELLVPPDPVEREILRTELDFYGLRGGAGVGDTLIPAPALQYYAPAAAGPLPPPGAERGAPDSRDERGAARDQEGGGPSAATEGWAVPSPHEVDQLLRKHGAWPRAAGPVARLGARYWVQGPASDFPRHADYSPEDAAARAVELGARRIFGEGGDGTAEVELVSLPEPGSPGIPRPDSYSRLKCPGPAGPALTLVESLAEFESNLEEFTLGLGSIVSGLPLVVAGGAVVAALHRWPGVRVPEDIPRWEGAAVDFFAREAPEWWQVQRWRGPIDAELRQLREQVRRLQGGTPVELASAHDRASLGRVAQMHGGRELVFVGGELRYEREGETPPDSRFRGFATADVDLFLTTRDPGQALRTIDEVHSRLEERIGRGAVRVFRSEHSVTFLGPPPWRPVQVILRLYHSGAHVVLGFDLDCCGVYYDGVAVRALPRAARALRARYNLIDTTRQSTTYEGRLAKYLQRGFDIAIPFGIPLGPVVDRARLAVGRWRAAREQPQLSGLALLVTMVEALAARDYELASRLGCRRSDYGPRGYPRSLGALHGAIWKNARRGATMPYVVGRDLAEVVAETTCRFGVVECPAAVPPRLCFLTEAPHRQNRIDILWSGSFHPLAASWLPA